MYDPVWKNIPITQLEKKIIESDIFKRLKNIKQMSLASISFSGANHTRFEHSIGTMHVAYQIASKIENLKEYSEQILLEKYNIKNGYLKTLQFIRIAALLHDLGHPPFSHAIEWVFERNPELFPGKEYSHDDYTQDLIKRNKQIKNILSAEKLLTPKNISDFLANKLNKLPAPIAILYPLLNGDLDFDKVDYIIRDNYHCGLPVNVDIHSIMDSFEINLQRKVTENSISNIAIMFKPEKLYVVENLLLSRKQLITIIQQETKNRIANQMLMASTQVFLKKKKQSLEKKEYKQLIQELHETWNDYDLVSSVTEKTVGSRQQSNYLYRALRGNLLQEIVRVEMFDLEPKERLEFYLFAKHKDRKVILERNINRKLHENFLIDFIFIKPPPLTINLVYDFEERVTSEEYQAEPVTFALHSKSNIVNGILIDSFDSSFIAIYGAEKKYNLDEITATLKFELVNQNWKVRKELIEKKQIAPEDLILLVLAAIRELAKENFKLSRLWVTGVKRFQDFISEFKERMGFVCPEFDYLSDDYSSKFDILITKLVTLGLVDKRKKHVAIKTRKDDKPILRFLDRNDFCLNSNGEEFVQHLPKEYLKIKKFLLELMLENNELYHEYLTSEYTLSDTVRQKEMRPKFEEKGLPIIDI